MPKVNNIDQLRAEINRLRGISQVQEAQIRKDVEQVRSDLSPVNLLLGALSSVTGIKFNKNAFLKDGVLFGLSILLQRIILKTEKKAESAVYGLVDVLFEKIQDFVGRHTSQEAKRDERKQE